MLQVAMAVYSLQTEGSLQWQTLRFQTASNATQAEMCTVDAAMVLMFGTAEAV
jgi:hypothetical protein